MKQKYQYNPRKKIEKVFINMDYMMIQGKYTTAKEGLFIHEAIPVHHFQVMLQKENQNLPEFRQNGGNSAFAESWGLYCESLGKQLGCYTNPYQYFDALGAEIHRAIRLVVDAGMHGSRVVVINPKCILLLL